MNWITRILDRWADARAMRNERDAAIAERDRIMAGVVKITEISASDNRGTIELELSKNMALMLCQGFAELVMDAENYVEMKYLPASDTESDDSVVVTATKCHGKTPHELRREAEQERDKWKHRCEQAESEIVPLCAAGPWRPVSEMPAKSATVLGWSDYGVDLFMYSHDYDRWTDSAGNTSKPVYIAQINPVEGRVI